MNKPDTNIKPKEIFLKDYTPPPFLVDTVDLEFDLHPEKTVVVSTLAVRPNPEAKAATQLHLDGELLELVHVLIDNSEVDEEDYDLDGKRLVLKNVPQKPFTLEIEAVCNPEANKALSGLYRTKNVYCTQCEAEGFRRITFFPDRPDVMSVYSVRIEADKADVPVMLSNGNMVESGDLDNGRHFAFWKDPHPKPCYLFALVGGDLARGEGAFTTMSGRKVTLHIYVEPGKEDRVDWAMDCLQRSMKWDEERFGREYDLDIFMIVAVSDFNMGAMENKGLNIFNDKLILARPDTATDADFERIEAVIAHEYFHNWTGNRITCRDWFQLCLKEGLTVFRDQEFTSDQRSRTVKRIDDVRMLRAHQFPEDGGPLAHPVRPASFIEINNFYTATIYEKGAELVGMIHTILGKDGFRAGLDLYFERHDGEATTVEKFITCFEDSSGQDFSQFMLWYQQAGTPQLTCSLSYDKAAKTAKLDVTQIVPPTPGQEKKLPQVIPLRMGLIGPEGKDYDLVLGDGIQVKDGVVMITQAEHSFTFTGITDRPVASYLRGFSAPVKLSSNNDAADLEFLMSHDSDSFNRWQAAQSYGLSLLVQSVKSIADGGTLADPKPLAMAMARVIRDESLEHSYRAQFLSLPGESEIAREIGKNVDTDAIHLVREKLRGEIARLIRDDLSMLYTDLEVKEDYSPGAEQVGKRDLRISCLSLLSTAGGSPDVARLLKHYNTSTNMSDTMAAMGCLVNMDVPEREQVLGAFYTQWKDDHLVIDKWFSLQAMSTLPQTLDEVRMLMDNELFDIKNPNKVRALIGAFAGGNPVTFNRADGAGYVLLTEAILELDKFNPQIAARMIGLFKNMRILEPNRQTHIRNALSQISKTEGLSSDSFEIVNKIIKG